MLAVSIKPIFGDDDNDDKSDDNVVMKSLFVTKKQHFLELHQDKVCLSVCYVLSSLSRILVPFVCLLHSILTFSSGVSSKLSAVEQS